MKPHYQVRLQPHGSRLTEKQGPLEFEIANERTGDQTERYLAALRNQTIHILGHPQGRIFNHREGLKADWPKVFAARLDEAFEIDGYPDRQDLKLTLLRSALKEGTQISLGTDAHHPWQLAFMEFALAAAVLAGFKPPQIVNFLSVDELRKWVSQISQPH